LERRGFSTEDIENVKSAFKILYKSKITARAAIDKIRQEYPGVKNIERFVDFIEKSSRGIAR
jgi:Acyl-[acyl carrier protein]--UDP-N-acetylglucosamine O-acyltransferase